VTQIHTQYDFPGGVISPSHSRETDIHDAGGIRVGNPRKRAVAETCLRLCGYRDRL